MYVCKSCKNTDVFIAEFMLQGECTVDGNGSELDGIDSSSCNRYCDTSMDTTIQKPYKCGMCGSTDITEVKEKKSLLKPHSR
jgi:hypothetical protein